MKTIEERINKLRAELQNLNNRHDAMVEENKRINQEFGQAVQQNQNRFQQLVGAIAELETMQNEEAADAQSNNGGDAVTPILTKGRT